jgi:hypothetical protein
MYLPSIWDRYSSVMIDRLRRELNEVTGPDACIGGDEKTAAFRFKDGKLKNIPRTDGYLA